MDKLSEYIPLLVIIASVVISLVRKAKQPGKEIVLPKEVFPEIPAYEEPVYEPVYEKPFPGKKVVTPVAAKSKAPAPEKKQPVAQKEPVSYKKTFEMHDIEAHESAGVNLSDPEEMKKAIIYSEIFSSPVSLRPVTPSE